MKLKHLTALALSMSSYSVFAQMQCSDVEQTTEAQCENLKRIWDQTNGLNWSDAQTNNWMQTNNPCEWDGVHCWGSRVARLYLGNKNLEGQLPDLSDLPELRTISVHTNKLTGDLPDVTLNKKLEQLFIIMTFQEIYRT